MRMGTPRAPGRGRGRSSTWRCLASRGTEGARQRCGELDVGASTGSGGEVDNGSTCRGRREGDGARARRRRRGLGAAVLCDVRGVAKQRLGRVLTRMHAPQSLLSTPPLLGWGTAAAPCRGSGLRVLGVARSRMRTRRGSTSPWARRRLSVTGAVARPWTRRSGAAAVRQLGEDGVGGVVAAVAASGQGRRGRRARATRRRGRPPRCSTRARPTQRGSMEHRAAS